MLKKYPTILMVISLVLQENYEIVKSKNMHLSFLGSMKENNVSKTNSHI